MAAAGEGSVPCDHTTPGFLSIPSVRPCSQGPSRWRWPPGAPTSVRRAAPGSGILVAILALTGLACTAATRLRLRVPGCWRSSWAPAKWPCTRPSPRSAEPVPGRPCRPGHQHGPARPVPSRPALTARSRHHELDSPTCRADAGRPRAGNAACALCSWPGARTPCGPSPPGSGRCSSSRSPATPDAVAAPAAPAGRRTPPRARGGTFGPIPAAGRLPPSSLPDIPLRTRPRLCPDILCPRGHRRPDEPHRRRAIHPISALPLVLRYTRKAPPVKTCHPLPVLRRTLTATAVAGGTAALMLVGIAAASAHVEATPDTTAANSYALLTFGIPHGCKTSGTTKMTITLPAELNDAQPTVNPNWTAQKVTEQLPAPKKLANGTSITNGPARSSTRPRRRWIRAARHPGALGEAARCRREDPVLPDAAEL